MTVHLITLDKRMLYILFVIEKVFLLWKTCHMLVVFVSFPVKRRFNITEVPANTSCMPLYGSSWVFSIDSNLRGILK